MKASYFWMLVHLERNILFCQGSNINLEVSNYKKTHCAIFNKYFYFIHIHHEKNSRFINLSYLWIVFYSFLHIQLLQSHHHHLDAIHIISKCKIYSVNTLRKQIRISRVDITHTHVSKMKLSTYKRKSLYLFLSSGILTISVFTILTYLTSIPHHPKSEKRFEQHTIQRNISVKRKKKVVFELKPETFYHQNRDDMMNFEEHFDQCCQTKSSYFDFLNVKIRYVAKNLLKQILEI